MSRGRRIKQCQSKISQWIIKIASKLIENYLLALILSIIACITRGIIAGDAKFFLYGIALILLTVITYFWVKIKKIWVPFFYILPLLLTAAVYFNRKWVDDLQYRFKKNKRAPVIGIIIPDFKSPIPKDGAIFAESLYTQLNNKIISPLQIELVDTSLSLEIKVQKLDVVLDVNEMKLRGKRRNADLGIIGHYRCYIEKGQHREEITNFKVVILDTQIATIFKEKQPFDSLYDFIVPIEDISVTRGDSVPAEELASSAVKYVTEMAANAKLLQTATQVSGWNRDQTLIELHKRLTNLGNLINNRALANFHYGNSLIRSAMNPKLSLADQREFFREATNAYWTSIRSFSESDSCQIKLEHPERIYFNLAWSYMQRGILTDNSAYKDSAEVVYDAAVARYPNRETLEEQNTFLAERCEEEFVLQKNTSRMARAEQLFEKYQLCFDALERLILLESRQLSKNDQIVLNNIASNRKLFEAHLNELRQSQ